MAYQSLYRRYRPRRFAEVRGQDHVTTALRNAVRDGRVGHAYLFSGPRGTGKTTTARIMAKVLNCANPVDGEPCLVCDSCRAIEAGSSFDLHELDAASNNKVDDIRDLIERVAYATPGRTKVYILDEVHMLTAAASAALLKTLEEPPEAVVFVLATTDPQKVIPTIRSRTQHLAFHLLPADELRQVIDDTGVDVDADAVDYALRAGAGSARDTLSALETVLAAGKVLEPADQLDDLMEGLAARDTAQALTAVARAISDGRDPRVLAEALLSRLRDVFLASMRADLSYLADRAREEAMLHAERFERAYITRCLEVLGEALIDMRLAPDPRVGLDVSLVRLTNVEADTSLAALAERVSRLERAAGTSDSPAAGSPAPRAVALHRASGGAPSAPQGPGAAAPGKRPADAARQALSEPQSVEPPSASPAPDRPTLGAFRTATVAEPVGAPAPAPAPAAPKAAGLPAPAEMNQAWRGAILERLPQRVRVRWAPGHFTAVEDGTAVYALPNQPTRDRCDEQRAEVEAALADHFGLPIAVRLVVDQAIAAPKGGEPERETVDVSELTDAPADKRRGLDVVNQHFPGAELIQGDEA
ncbi:MAG: DNA polymerase III subunit gamma/tau [Acidimicrobiales bacterium]